MSEGGDPVGTLRARIAELKRQVDAATGAKKKQLQGQLQRARDALDVLLEYRADKASLREQPGYLRLGERDSLLSSRGRS